MQNSTHQDEIHWLDRLKLFFDELMFAIKLKIDNYRTQKAIEKFRTKHPFSGPDNDDELLSVDATELDEPAIFVINPDDADSESIKDIYAKYGVNTSLRPCLHIINRSDDDSYGLRAVYTDVNQLPTEEAATDPLRANTI